VVFLGAAVYFVVVGRRHPGREESVWRAGREPAGPPPPVDTPPTSESKREL
jgi:hypothetical protein